MTAKTWTEDEVLVTASIRRCPLTGTEAVCVLDPEGRLIRVLCRWYDAHADTCSARLPPAPGDDSTARLSGILSCALAVETECECTGAPG